LSLEQNKEIVRRQFQLISAGDAKLAAALFAQVSFNHGRKVDRESISKVFESLIALREKFTVQEIIAEGDWVACRTIVSGKHDKQPAIPVGSGVYSVTKPTGAPYTIQHIHMFKIVGGEIVEHWANRDDLGAARQMGLELAPSVNSKNERA
jgi:predicted ester cyclase